MNNIFHLFKVQVLSSFGINKMLKGKKNKFFNGILGLTLALIGVFALFVALSVVYSNVFAETLILGGKSINRLIPTMLSLAFVLVLFFSFYSVSNVIYEFKDYEMLSSMPIKKWQIIVAKFLFTFLFNLLISIVIVVPSLFVLSSRGGVVSAKTIFNTLIMVVCSPFLPLAISCVIGVAFLLFSSLFKHKNLVQILLYVLIFVGYGVFSFVSFGEDMDSFKLIETLYFIMPISVNGFFYTKYALLNCLIGILSFSVVFAFVCLTYSAVRNKLSVRHRDKNFTLKTYDGKGQLKSLYTREMKRLFSIPVYTLNGLFGPLICIILSVLVLILGDSILGLANQSVSLDSLTIILLPIFCFCLFTAPTTASSISLEGNNLWVLRTMPLDIKKLFLSNILVNCTFTFVPVILVSIIGSIILKLSFLVAVLLCLNAGLIAISSGTLALTFNLLLPKFKWENAQQVVKQGMPVLFSMLSGMLLSALMILFTQYISNSTVLFLGVFGIFFLALLIFTIIVIFKKGEKLIYRKIDG